MPKNKLFSLTQDGRKLYIEEKKRRKGLNKGNNGIARHGRLKTQITLVYK